MTRDERSSGSGPGAAAADPMMGQILDGRYRLTEKLGEGGMGEVYAAEHVHIEKRVAIKLLRSEILTNVEAVTRFRQEARSASSIGHRNIITIEDFGQLPDGRIFLAMELLHGAPLSELIKGFLAPERLLGILIQTGQGLSAAHRKGIVHRDMKPENVFVTLTPGGEEVPKLLDFGIAKMSAGDGNNHLTKTGTIFGTPFYMAPEQALGQNVDHRADIYAMGVIMYEAFGGVVPFEGESFMAILTQHITSEPRPLAHVASQHGKALPPGIEEVVARAMRKEAEQRFQSMDDLVAALIQVHRGLAAAGMNPYSRGQASAGNVRPTPAGGVGFHAQPGLPGRSGTLAGSPPPGSRPPTPMPHVSAPGASGPIGREDGGSVRYPVPEPDPQFASGMRAPADSGHVPRSRSRAGLIAILFILMAVVGGGVALLVQSPKQENKEARAEPSADAPSPGVVVKPARRGAGDRDTRRRKSDPKNNRPDMEGKVTAPGAGADVAIRPDTAAESAAENGGDIDPGSGPAVDPGSGPDIDPGSGPAVDPGSGPAVAKVVVLVNSRPQGAEMIAADGASLGTTPINVWVEPGKPLEVTLKLRGRKDLHATIDDRKKKVTLKLERIARPEPGGTHGGEIEPSGGETDEPRGPCASDPRSVECRCLRDPDLPECILE